MKEGTRQLLDKAARAIRAAATLVRDDNLDFAAGRAYYAMFYVAEALLHERDLGSKKHGGVHALFGEHFAKTGIVDPKFLVFGPALDFEILFGRQPGLRLGGHQRLSTLR
jgi:uncharacterized protein (UPF0332 family)